MSCLLLMFLAQRLLYRLDNPAQVRELMAFFDSLAVDGVMPLLAE